MKNNLINTISALAMSGLLVVSGTGVAQAAPAQATPETTAVSYDDSFLSSSEQNDGTQMQEAIDAVADDLENLFTRYVPQTDGTFTVNSEAIIADGYGQHLFVFEDLAIQLNRASSMQDAGSSDIENRDAASYAKCVIYGALGIPTTAFGAGTWTAIVTAVKAWNWGLAASTVVRALGPAFVTGAGKALGGPVVVAAALASAAAWCAFQ